MFDRYLDLQEGQLLAREQPPSHVTAADQLTKAKIKFREIVRVESDAILFVADDGTAQTAWSEVRPYPSGAVVFYRQPGFPAFPSPYLKDTG